MKIGNVRCSGAEIPQKFMTIHIGKERTPDQPDGRIEEGPIASTTA
jgi:hypothetical protein